MAGSGIKNLIIPAGSRVHLSELDVHFKVAEGTVIYAVADFDHPNMGLAWETYDLITTVNLRLGQITGTNRPENFLYVSTYGSSAMYNGVPLRFYVVNLVKELSWRDWLKLYAFNDDTRDHTLLGINIFGARLFKPIVLGPTTATEGSR